MLSKRRQKFAMGPRSARDPLPYGADGLCVMLSSMSMLKALVASMFLLRSSCFMQFPCQREKNEEEFQVCFHRSGKLVSRCSSSLYTPAYLCPSSRHYPHVGNGSKAQHVVRMERDLVNLPGPDVEYFRMSHLTRSSSLLHMPLYNRRVATGRIESIQISFDRRALSSKAFFL